MDATALTLKLEREPSLGLDDAVPVRAAPDAGAIGRFNDYMTPAPAAADGVAPASAAGAEDAIARAGRATPGDGILNGLNSLGADMSRDWQSVKDVLAGKNMPDIKDMLSVQVSLIGLSMHHELVNKCVTRSTQNLDQLVKLQ